MRRILLTFSLCLIVVSGGAGLGYLLYAQRTEPPRRELGTLPPLATSVTLTPQTVTDRYVGYGVVAADRVANVAAEISAIVKERVAGIEAGDAVAQGQPLIELSSDEYEHNLARALALVAAEEARQGELNAESEGLERLLETADRELQVAANERTRLGELIEQNMAAKKEFDFANLAYHRALRVKQSYEMDLAVIGPRAQRAAASKRSLEADVELARLNLARCVLRAPFSGVIRSIEVDAGDRVGPGSPVLSIVDASRCEVPVQLPAGVYNGVVIGAACRLESPSAPGRSWSGVVSRIAPVADEQTRTFAVYIDLDNTTQEYPVLPGTFLRVIVDGPTHRDALLVPRGAVRNGQVLIAEGNVVRRRRIEVAGLIGDKIRVASGLSRGDRVITSHLESLDDGALVRLAAGATPVARKSATTPTDGSGASQ